MRPTDSSRATGDYEAISLRDSRCPAWGLEETPTAPVWSLLVLEHTQPLSDLVLVYWLGCWFRVCRQAPPESREAGSQPQEDPRGDPAKHPEVRPASRAEGGITALPRVPSEDSVEQGLQSRRLGRGRRRTFLDKRRQGPAAPKLLPRVPDVALSTCLVLWGPAASALTARPSGSLSRLQVAHQGRRSARAQGD